eukprot:530231-Pyramimonas_sp.AAC.1
MHASQKHALLGICTNLFQFCTDLFQITPNGGVRVACVRQNHALGCRVRLPEWLSSLLLLHTITPINLEGEPAKTSTQYQALHFDLHVTKCSRRAPPMSTLRLQLPRTRPPQLGTGRQANPKPSGPYHNRVANVANIVQGPRPRKTILIANAPYDPGSNAAGASGPARRRSLLRPSDRRSQSPLTVG